MKNLQKLICIGASSFALSSLMSANAQVITAWNFDNLTAATNLTPAPSSGVNSSTSTATSVGMTSTGTANYPTAHATGPDTSNVTNVQGTDTDNSGAANNVWRIVGTNGWNSGAGIGTQGAQFNVSTAGFTNVTLSFDLMITVQGEADMQVEYTTNGTTWTNAALTYSGSLASVLTNSSNANIVTGTYFHGTSPNANDTWFNGITANFGSVANNDPNFGVRIVNAATGTADVNIKTGVQINNTSGNWRLDDVTLSGTEVTTPEPSTYALMLSGLAMLVAMHRLRRNTQAKS